MSNSEDAKLAAIVAAAAAFLALLLGTAAWMLDNFQTGIYKLALNVDVNCRASLSDTVDFAYVSEYLRDSYDCEIATLADEASESASGWYFFAVIGTAILALVMVVVSLIAIVVLVRNLYAMWRKNRAITTQYKQAIIDHASRPNHGSEIATQINQVAENVKSVAQRLEDQRVQDQRLRRVFSGLSSREPGLRRLRRRR